MSTAAHEESGGEGLDRELAGLLEVERFPAPQAFREQALLRETRIQELPGEYPRSSR